MFLSLLLLDLHRRLSEGWTLPHLHLVIRTGFTSFFKVAFIKGRGHRRARATKRNCQQGKTLPPAPADGGQHLNQQGEVTLG